MNVSERITELWKTWRFVDAIDLFNQKILEDLFTGEEVAQFWGLIVEDFLKGKPRVKRLEVSETTFDKAHLPQKTEIVVLTHAL